MAGAFAYLESRYGCSKEVIAQPGDYQLVETTTCAVDGATDRDEYEYEHLLYRLAFTL